MLKIRKLIQFFIEYASDFWIYLKFNGYSPFVDSQKRLFYKLIIESHTIEKGLSLTNRRNLFGREKIKFVIDGLRKYDFSFSPLPAEMSIGALDAYLLFHATNGVEDPYLSEIRDFVLNYKTAHTTISRGGTKSYDLTNAASLNSENFMQSRASVRMFAPNPIPLALINSIIQIAQSAPSQCNRQSSHIHFYQNQHQIAGLLNLQGGSRGFADQVGNLFVVTSEISAWGGAGQRNQLYVDGSLFAMNVLLACHAKNLAACPLNLAVLNSVERKIKMLGGIPAGERLIMMIAFGNTVSEPIRVAKSPRRNLNEILLIHGDVVE